MRRTLCVLFVVSALTAACGDDEEDPPTTVPTSAVTTPAAGGTSSTAVPGSIAQGVTDGSTCSPVGARGRTQGGIDLVCTPIAGGNELRWRPA